jgi:TfoX/Sxy family transcriptional regulator of competence genes
MAGYGKSQRRAILDPVSDPDEPRLRTPLGRRLWLLRQQAVRSGQPLLDWDDLSREVAERRGEKTR